MKLSGANNMKTQTIGYMKENGMIQLSKWQRFWHFYVVIFLYGFNLNERGDL